MLALSLADTIDLPSILTLLGHMYRTPLHPHMHAITHHMHRHTHHTDDALPHALPSSATPDYGAAKDLPHFKSGTRVTRRQCIVSLFPTIFLLIVTNCIIW